MHAARIVGKIVSVNKANKSDPDAPDHDRRWHEIRRFDASAVTDSVSYQCIVIRAFGLKRFRFCHARPGTNLMIDDLVATGDQSVAALEFSIGGRVALRKGSLIQIVGERSVTGSGETIARFMTKAAVLWVKADAKQLRQPLEIQTNGGVIGIKG